MKRMIFIRCMFVTMAAVLIMGVLSSLILLQVKEAEVSNSILDFLHTVTSTVDFNKEDSDLASRLSALYHDYRVTILDSDGSVISDSHYNVQDLENYSRKEEFANAIISGEGIATRYSSEDNQYQLYAAVRSTDQDVVVRIAVPMSQLRRTIYAQIPAVLVGLTVALVAAIILGAYSTRTIMEPLDNIQDSIIKIGEGNYGWVLPEPRYEELSPLVNSVNTLSKGIRKSVTDLRFERRKLEFLIDSMDQGIIVVDGEGNLIHTNQTARKLFGDTDARAMELMELTHNQKIIDGVHKSLDTAMATWFDIEDEINGRIFSVTINPIDSKWVHHGTLILISNVTQNRRYEQIRREFFANASHELKTPITSISGFAELLSSGMVTDSQRVIDYTKRIKAESDRMIALINDILQISVLEETGQRQNISTVDLLEQARQVQQNLMPQAMDRNITISVDGEPALIQADRNDMQRILTNLMENAVKYNNDGGSVNVTVGMQDPETCVVKVKDTGIGIPNQDIPRIFERFYRVDKGRSRAIGGTGLGLSIVKHLVAAYDGEINIKTQLGEGTEFVVRIPTTIRGEV